MIGFTFLATKQVICHLVIFRNVINSAVDKSQPQHHLNSLPDGYVAYPQIGVAYKFYKERDVSLIEARVLCIQKGAQLAVFDSAEKLDFVGRHIGSEWVYAGIIRTGDTWVNVNTGLPVPSIPWRSGYPYEGSKCAVYLAFNKGLAADNCGQNLHYVCEFPISRYFNITGN